jgi:ABC-type transport system substrate-binding protein
MDPAGLALGLWWSGVVVGGGRRLSLLIDRRKAASIFLGISFLIIIAGGCTDTASRDTTSSVTDYPDDIHISDVPATKRHFANGSVPEPLPFDPERASQVFESAGWVDSNNDGIREKDGQDFRFTLSVSPETEAQGIYVQERLRRVGVRMEVSTFERSVLRQRARTHDFDATIEEYNFVEQYRDFPTSGYVNPEVSRLASTLWYTMDQEKSDEYLREIWQIVATDVPITYLHPKMSYSAAHRRVKGLQNN